HPLHDTREGKPEWIAPREMCQLVREHDALLLEIQLLQCAFRQADLGDAERDGAGDARSDREAWASPELRRARELLQLGEQTFVRHGTPVTDTTHEDEAA